MPEASAVVSADQLLMQVCKRACGKNKKHYFCFLIKLPQVRPSTKAAGSGFLMEVESADRVISILIFSIFPAL